MKQNDVIDFLIREKSNLVEIFIVGILLALGVNLVANTLVPLLNLSQLNGLFIGFMLIIIAIAYLAAKLFGRRQQVKKYEAFIIYDVEKNILVNVPRYEVGEDIVHYFDGTFVENPAMKTIWDKEPLQNIRETVWGRNELERNYPKSMELISEAVEYYIIQKLSTHLADYFSSVSFNETKLQKYSRNDIPQVLLSNRFLELFSRPMIDRPKFVNFALDDSGDEPESIWFEDGAIYERFRLTLPRDSDIQRLKAHTIVISTSRMLLTIESDFEGFSFNLPRGFATYYLGITDSENDEFFQKFMELTVPVRIKVSFKFGALYSSTGWEYYRWVDSFLNSLDVSLSAESFFSNLNWENVYTIILALRNSKRPT